MAICYLLHIEPAYKHAGHYIGYSTNGVNRLKTHLAGHGSPLIRAAIAAGHEIKLVKIWKNGSRQLERKLHNRHGSRLCPICNSCR